MVERVERPHPTGRMGDRGEKADVEEKQRTLVVPLAGAGVGGGLSRYKDASSA